MAPNSVVSKRLLMAVNSKPQSSPATGTTMKKGRKGKHITESSARARYEERRTDRQTRKTARKQRAAERRDLQKRPKRTESEKKKACIVYHIVRSIVNKYRRLRRRHGVCVHVLMRSAVRDVHESGVLHDHGYARVPPPALHSAEDSNVGDCEVSLEDLIDHCPVDEDFLGRAIVSHDEMFKDLLDSCTVPSGDDDLFEGQGPALYPVVCSCLAFVQRGHNQGIFTTAGCTGTSLSTCRLPANPPSSPCWGTDPGLCGGLQHQSCAPWSQSGASQAGALAVGGEGGVCVGGSEVEQRSAADATWATKDQRTRKGEEDGRVLVRTVAEMVARILSDEVIEKMRHCSSSEARSPVDGAVRTHTAVDKGQHVEVGCVAGPTSPGSVCDDGHGGSAVGQAATRTDAVPLGVNNPKTSTSRSVSVTTLTSSCSSQTAAPERRPKTWIGWKRKWEEDEDTPTPAKLLRETTTSCVTVMSCGAISGGVTPVVQEDRRTSVQDSSRCSSASVPPVCEVSTVSCHHCPTAQPDSPGDTSTTSHPLPQPLSSSSSGDISDVLSLAPLTPTIYLPLSPEADISDVFSLPPPLSPLPDSPPPSPADSGVGTSPPVPCLSPEQGGSRSLSGDLWWWQDRETAWSRETGAAKHNAGVVVRVSSPAPGFTDPLTGWEDEDCGVVSLKLKPGHPQDLEVIDEDLTTKIHARPPLPLSPFNNAHTMGRFI